MSFSKEEMEEFAAEALELLDVAEKNLLALDQGGEFKGAFDAIFRGFHNLKGSAGMMELARLQSHTHELENILMRYKDSDRIPKEYLSLFLRGVDAARSILRGEEVSFNFSVESAPGSGEFVAECDDIVERVSKNLQTLEAGEGGKDCIDALYRDVHSLKGSAYLFSYAKLGSIAHSMEASLERVRDGAQTPTPELTNSLFKSLSEIERAVDNIKNNKTDEIAEPIQHVSTAKDREAEAVNSIRVQISLLDNLMTLMGEMVLVRNQVLQYSSKSEDLEFLSMSKRLNVVTSEIQGEMMKTRMQPIGNVINKFTRVVRDLSQELKKSISLTLHGTDTELDKSLLEAIKDPLTHIVRNSCDHGIEAADVRRHAGKPEMGTITIRSYHEGGQVVIEVSDDGKGLSKEILINKALDKGLITSAQATAMSDKEAFSLIFAPGFSTATNVTNLSGRGVGMDVVRTNIDRIGGVIELSSVEGKGTSIKIKIPLTLAIVPALIVKCGGGTYAIPQVKLEELVRVDQSSDNKIELLHGVPVYRLRGNILPLVDLNQILGRESSNNDRIANIAVLNAEHCSFGMIIDEVQDTADIVVKPLTRLLKSLQVYSGATILGDGSVALILDVLGVAKVAQLGAKKIEGEDHRVLENVSRRVADLQDFLLVKIQSPTKHALALNYVHRLEEFKRKDIEFSGAQRVIRYRNIILPLVSANEQLGYASTDSNSESIPVVVVQKAGSLYGIEVDCILDTLSTPTEVDTALVEHPGIFGNLNTKEELIVVVDPFEMISRAFPDANSEMSAASGPKKILLVEDTVFFRRALLAALEKAGHQVVVAGDGEEALEILNRQNSHFDLIVSDIEMPRVNGFQLAARVRQHPYYGQTPMLAISSRADKRYKEEGAKAGFNVYLEKLKTEKLLFEVARLTQDFKAAS